MSKGQRALRQYTKRELVSYDQLKKLYRQNIEHLKRPTDSGASSNVKIPKIIHQIWLGSSFPTNYKKYQESWIKNHPDWEYKLWTDHEVKKIKLYNQQLFDEAQNYGEKSDILRYELLYYYGGLYVDVDFECLKSFDILHTAYDFYAGISNTSLLELNNALIGCARKHPLMRLCITSIDNKGSKTNFLHILNRTGPGHFTRCFQQYTNIFPEDIIAMPISIFYPIPNSARNYTALAMRKYIQTESYAAHYWGCNWQKKA